jgi:O-methyltransferase involved in polyketide biosynthesis
MQSTKVELRGVKETSLITLYARALQSRWATPILSDPWATEAVARLNYNFEAFKIGIWMTSLVAARACQLDSWTKDFLAQHPGANVLHLACGLDSRVFRVDPPTSVAWFDVDFPEVVELRQRLYPERAGCRVISSPLSNLDWLREVPTHRPTLIVAEGLVMYLTEDELKQLFGRLIEHTRTGQLAFDSHSRQAVEKLRQKKWNVRGTGATFQWGLGDATEVSKLDPRLTSITERQAHQLSGFHRAPWRARLLIRALDLVPALRMMRCVLCRFG